MSSLSGGDMTEEHAKEIAEAMPNDILRTYVLPAVRCPLTDNLIRKAVQFYFSPDPRLKNSVLQRFGEIKNWDVSRVTNMSYMFYGATSFNQPLNDWDVSNVKNMNHMFSGATSFNQPLDEWDVSKVTDMAYMFEKATPFNQPLNNWNVSHVTDMAFMFARASSFNQPLNNWDVSTVLHMEYMFKKARSFNQPLDNWDASKVINTRDMFAGTSLEPERRRLFFRRRAMRRASRGFWAARDARIAENGGGFNTQNDEFEAGALSLN